MENVNNTVDQNPSEVNTEKVKPVRSTLAELLKTELKLLCNHCGWKIEPNSRHSRSCRYVGHPHYNHDANVSYRASSIALAPTPALVALDMDLKYDNTQKDQDQTHQGGQGQNTQHQGGRGQNTQHQGGRGYNRNRPPYDPNYNYNDTYQGYNNNYPNQGKRDQGNQNQNYYGSSNPQSDYRGGNPFQSWR